MMEAVEATLVEGAVLWLAQTILANLLLDKLDEWLTKVGLADDIEKLKSEVEEVEAMAASVKGRSAGNRLLALRLSRLKELLYDADDLVDELDYHRLQDQVEGGTSGCATPHGTNGAEQVDGSRDNYRLQHQVEGGRIAWDIQHQGTGVNGGAQLVDGPRDNSGVPNRNGRKKRSKAWEEFSITEEDTDGKPVRAKCIHCGTHVRCETSKGTSVLHNHLKSDSCKRKRAAIEQTPNPSSADDGAQNGATILTHDSDRRKRMRSDEEILVSHVTPKRTLLILDDVWDDIDVCRWNKLLAPLRSDNAKGNMVIVTTRKLSVAKRIGTVDHINLGRLQDDDFWLFFKDCAFGDETYKEHGNLSIIGQKIANNLQGNPLAAQTAGMLLREHLTTDRWGNILKNEIWKSLQLNGGIMHALKLSYDELPYYLQQCFLYCSIFPNNYQFLSSELVCIWISQGFVKCSHSTERLEEIGQNYLTDLLNSGFFQQVGTKDPTLGDQTLYVMSALMHDFARLVSGNECAAIDSSACREVLPTIRHLSILTYSAYPEDKYGNITRNEKFEEKLQRVVNSTRKLRTLVLIGKYDHFFLQSLQGIFQKSHNLRVLQISEVYASFGYFACSLVDSTHVRYLKIGTKEHSEVFPEDLSKFYHLQVLDMGLDSYSTLPNGINNLISLRHLVASKAANSSISNIGKMTSLQELHDFNCSSFEIAQLQSLSGLAQLCVSQLENVVTREEALGAKLSEKSHLEKLHLSWDDIRSECEYGSDMSWEPSLDAVETGTSKEVLEGLEPHLNLKHLQISGYRSSTSPDWLVSTVSVTCLQTLHLEDCRELQVLPSLERLPLLTMLKLRNMWKVRQVRIPSVEELVLIEMPKLKSCFCNSARDFNSSLRVLTIKGCRVLKLIVSDPLPPSSSTRELSIARVSTLPTMEASSSAELIIGMANVQFPFGAEDSNGLTKLDDKILNTKTDQGNGRWLLPHSLRILEIDGSPEMLQPCFLEGGNCLIKLLIGHSPSLEILQLCFCTALEELIIDDCELLAALEGNFTCLRKLVLSGNSGLESLGLYSCTALEELTVESCEALTALEGNFTSLRKLDLSGSPRMKSLRLGFCTTLEHLEIYDCEVLDTLEDLGSLRGLRYVDVSSCPRLPPLERLLSQCYDLCAGLERLGTDDLSFLTTSFCKGLTSLQRLSFYVQRLSFYGCTPGKVWRLTDEQERALQLLTSLQELRFEGWSHVEDFPVGLHSLPSLKKLVFAGGLSRLLEKDLPPSLEELEIRYCSKELTDVCRMLATRRSKPKIKIDWKYVN
ncbi:hypothetical protein HU200_064209 [Digitaria exilis]|uniref:BED-type domain-containing protein n=1 Tax=Digitaria exilis TaxID=1010633 RepID=A0A835A3U3_9POAL|nr:hypothetical protein HU200_064209 [Digitaria exilis]